MTTRAQHFDAIVVGSGQGGTPLASALARAGRRTALVERAHVGGTCVNVGCTPTKTMIASARVAQLARRAADFGVVAGPVSVDLGRVRARQRRVVESFRAGSEHGLADAGVALLRGTARFTGARALAVDGPAGTSDLLTADLVVINTGAHPVASGVPGLTGAGVLDSTSILELEELPEHLVVVGGGYVGVELAQMVRRFGSGVTLIQRGPQLMPREDRDVADALRDVLVAEAIDVVLDAQVLRADRAGAGIRLTVAVQGAERGVDASHVLVAAGRAPATEALDLGRAGVETDAEGFVRVNDRLETTAAGVYAIGDVVRGPAFTHASYDDFRILKANLIDGGRRSRAGRLVPYTVFTDPQLGRVGLTEQEARAERRRVRVARLPMTDVARAIETDETRGVLKAVVDAETDRILGCAFLGADAGELMSIVQVAMLGDLPFTALRDGIFAHPTLAESLNNLFAALAD